MGFNSKSIVSIIIGLIVVSFLIPLGINTIYQNPIQIVRETSLNSSDRTFVFLNNSYNGSWDGSVLQPSFTEFNNVTYNTSSDVNVSFYIEFTLSVDNSSAINITDFEICVDNVLCVEFTSIFSNFTFNTTYNATTLTPFNLVSFNFKANITSNVTLFSNAKMIEIYTTELTDSLNTIYYVIPLLSVVIIVIIFVKRGNK